MDMQAILNKKWKLRSNEKGVTLIELLAVVVILGIIAGVAGVAVSGSFTSAKQNADNANMAIIRDAVQRAVFEEKSIGATTSVTTSTTVLSQLQTDGYLNTVPKVQNDNANNKKYFAITVSANDVVTVTIQTEA
jgi:prepilin-type N-terminal cleavage/methylation domain-containing protein